MIIAPPPVSQMRKRDTEYGRPWPLRLMHCIRSLRRSAMLHELHEPMPSYYKDPKTKSHCFKQLGKGHVDFINSTYGNSLSRRNTYKH